MTVHPAIIQDMINKGLDFTYPHSDLDVNGTFTGAISTQPEIVPEPEIVLEHIVEKQSNDSEDLFIKKSRKQKS